VNVGPRPRVLRAKQNPDDGKSQIVEKYRVGGDPAVGEAPNNLLNDVKSAADGCPVGVIKVEE